MDPRFADYYSRELQHLRTSAAEFAKAFPKIAQRLSLDEFECKDPYVERLLEGFAFLAARVQLKLDSQLPDFARHLLDVVHPDYLAPMPSMTVVALGLNPKDGLKPEGLLVQRDTTLHSLTGPGDATACEYRTVQDARLWPIELVTANYLDSSAAIGSAGFPVRPGSRAALRLRFRILGGIVAKALDIDELDLYFCGSSPIPAMLFEAFHRDGMGFYLRPLDGAVDTASWQARASIRRIGWESSEAVLPEGPLMFSGYRLLREYFAMPERFLYARLTGIRDSLRNLGNATEFELLLPLTAAKPGLARTLEASNIRLNCVPAVNLFPSRVDRVVADAAQREFQIVVDRTRPTHYEVYSVSFVDGHGVGGERVRRFVPFFASGGTNWHTSDQAYFTLRREPRLLSARERLQGSRGNYYGSEAFVSLVDYRQKPFSTAIHQLEINALVTNRDLPLQMPVGRLSTDFHPPSGLPIDYCRCVVGPTAPTPAPPHGEATWRLISFLSLNYLALCDRDDAEGAAVFRELLTLHCRPQDNAAERMIGGLRSVSARPRILRLPVTGPAVFARGTQVDLRIDEHAFEGGSSFLLGSILEAFLARYTHVNSFTETVLSSIDHGELARWPARLGTRPLQ